MTEQEARQKWCPFVRFNETGANRWTFKDCPDDWGREERENPDMARCIASDCCAWRWKDKAIHAENRKTDEGYCGLAGKP